MYKNKIHEFMKLNGINYLLVNSTNKYLVEYPQLEENSRYKLTGFSGSTGDALVTLDKIFLFVDGRYHIQADQEVNHELVDIVKLQIGDNFLDELVKKIPQNEILGVFSKKNSQIRIEQLKNKSVNLKFFDEDPLDDNCICDNSNIIKVDGIPVEEKIKDPTFVSNAMKIFEKRESQDLE